MTYYTQECTEQLESVRKTDEEAVELLERLVARAYRKGLPYDENSSHDHPHHPSHRCPVGARVPTLADYAFSELLPMPWTGELYAESSDGRTLYRMYFIERRPQWKSPTDQVVYSGVGSKPVDENTAWCPDDQTDDMHNAMKSGVAYCQNIKYRWRRWDSA